MLFTICAIVRRRMELEQNPERRETLMDMLELLEPKEALKTPREEYLEGISRVRQERRH